MCPPSSLAAGGGARTYNEAVTRLLTCLCVVLAFTASWAALPAARQDTPQQPTFRAAVKLVRVDVSVTGKDDEPVENLQAADFEVEEDGVRQQVSTLQFVRLGAEPPREESLDVRSASHGDAEASREDVRTFVIFLDDYHISKLPPVVMPLRYALSTFVDRLEPSDIVALVDPLTPLSAMRFTRSKTELKEVINHFQGRMGEIFPVRSVVEEGQLQSRNVARVRAQVTLTALAAVATRLGGLKEGRKSIVFVSQGPPLFHLSIDGDIEAELKAAIDAANRGNVVIHVLDPRGLSGPGFGFLDTLYRLANDTGGRTIVRTNSLTENLRRAAADARAYYLLGYAPSRAEDDGKFHKISVKVKRPGMRVLARRGYWAPDGKAVATAAAERKPPVPGVAEAHAVMARAKRREIAEAWLGFARGEGGRTSVAVTWQRAAEGRQEAATLAVDMLSPDTRKVIEPEQAIAAPPGGEPPAPALFAMAPGGAIVRFTARDAAGATLDQWEYAITVPDLATTPVALSTPRFYRARSLPELRALQAVASPPPSASREFARGDRVFVDVECYTAGGAAAEMSVQLLSSDGRELAPLGWQPTKAGDTTKARLELPLGSLGRGTYLLRIRASLGEAKTEQVAGFRVG